MVSHPPYSSVPKRDTNDNYQGSIPMDVGPIFACDGVLDS